jgi:hypothetical protein
MDNFISDFNIYCLKRNWNFDKFSSEFTFQFRICRYLEEINNSYNIELESNIQKHGYKKLIKKEIDIEINESDSRKIAIELKYVRDRGSFNIGMYKFCEDIKFLEELVETKFNVGYAIIFTNIKEIYSEPSKSLKPRNEENTVLYTSFRIDKKLTGELKIKTGKMDESLYLKGEYHLHWEDFGQSIKACVVKVENISH